VYLAQPVRHNKGVWVVTRSRGPGELAARAPDGHLALVARCLLCSVSDAVNVLHLRYLRLPCLPVLTYAAFPGRR
jgi:hypothetical protein